MSRRRKRMREKGLRHRRPPRGRVAAGTGLTLGAAFALTPAAQAADFTVDDNTDAPLGTCTAAANDCSIRDAVGLSNTPGGPDRILFASSVTGSIILVDQLDVMDDVEILGPGAGVLEISGDESYRIFNIYGGAANVTVSGLTLRDGFAGGSDGGAIMSQGSNLTIADSVITGNEAYNPAYSLSYARGGGIASFGGSLAVRNSTLAGNYAIGYVGLGAAIYAYETHPVTISDSTLTENGVFGLEFGAGGGISADSSGVTIERTTLHDNYAVGLGDSVGGGVATYDGATTIERSTVSGNTAAEGGGVSSVLEQLRVLNSTASGNQAKYEGGGIASEDGTVELTNSTVAGNITTESDTAGGGMFLCNCSNAAIRNSILADNVADDGPDLEISGGSPPDTAFSLIEAPVGGGTINETVAGSNKLGVDPQLGALGANGGPTQTQALPMSSPAVDAGSNFGAGIDQRGESRPFDLMSVPNSLAAGANGTDMGAFELQGSNPTGEGPGCQGKPATILAQPGVKTVGTSGDDVIIGTRGPDNVDAGAGNDTICLFDGDDFTKGGAGNDLVLAGPDADKVKGGAGDDKLRGRGGRDRLSGKGGDDRIRGGHGNDVLTGGPGNDRMRGGAGDDIVDGKFEEDGKRHGGGGDDDRGGGKHGSKG